MANHWKQLKCPQIAEVISLVSQILINLFILYVFYMPGIVLRTGDATHQVTCKHQECSETFIPI